MKVDKLKILELYDEGKGLSIRAIHDALGYSRNTITKTINAAKESGLDKRKLAELDRTQAGQLLNNPTKPSDYEIPDFGFIQKELDTYPEVNLKLCWSEYHTACIDKHTTPYMYSRFCDLYRAWTKKNNVTRRIVHKPGYAMQVDYAGSTGAVVDRVTGEITKAYFFVAAFPYSGKMFSEASPDMKQASWVGAHVSAFRFFGGVPVIVVPDNLKTGVAKPDRYEPKINDVYADMARHYGTTVVPARVACPKGKAAVERAVQIIETWVIAALRHRTFFTFAELNEAVCERIFELNATKMAMRETTRDELFEEAERPYLRPLPAEDFEVASWKKVKCAQDCHFQLERQRYSAPSEFIGLELDVRITSCAVTAYRDGVAVCTHRRLYGRIGQYSTKEEHMPDHLRASNKTWSEEGFLRWAAKIGPECERVIKAICASKVVVEQAYRSCRGVIALAEKKGAGVVEKACAQALEVTSRPSYTQIRNIVSNLEVSMPNPTDVDDLCKSRLGDVGFIRDLGSYTLRRD